MAKKANDLIWKEHLDKEALKKSRAIIGSNYYEKLYEIEKDLQDKEMLLKVMPWSKGIPRELKASRRK